MSLNSPRIREGSGHYDAPFPFGEIPDHVIVSIGKQIVHRLAVGMGDITGDDWGSIFADSVDGVHRASPIGIADVEWNGCGWSVKTVKHDNPFRARKVRLISGRNSPDYSLGITDPHKNIDHTGRAVLAVWNQRINVAQDAHPDLRIMVLVRNVQTKEFLVFEKEGHRFAAENYRWEYTKPRKKNAHRNLEGFNRLSNKKEFTWQFHGSQFTIHTDIPPSARRFKIMKNVPLVDPAVVLDYVQFSDDWVSILG